MRSSTTQPAPVAIRSRTASLVLSLSLLSLSGTGWAADGMYLELPGLERAEVISAKPGDGMQVATGIAGRCESAA